MASHVLQAKDINQLVDKENVQVSDGSALKEVKNLKGWLNKQDIR